MHDWLFVSQRDQSREHLCSWDGGAAFFSSLGEYASSAGTYIAENAGTITQIAGTAIQVGSAIQQAEAQAQQGREQAAIIDQETMLERQATQRRNRQILGRNRAVAAASGVDPFSGSPLEVELANAFEAGMNEELIQFSGNARARQARLGAKFARQQIPGIVGYGIAKGGSIMSDWYSKSKGTSNPPKKTRASSFDSYWGG